MKTNLSKKFLFVGNRLEVLLAMMELCKDLKIFIQANTYAAKVLKSTLSQSKRLNFAEFSTKAELLQMLENSDFDVLVSNGCPYILPISKLSKNGRFFINCHPSLLPNLRGTNSINGAILFRQTAGATCHLMSDEIDSGAIVSQVSVNNDDSVNLPLLYQMSFLAEKEAFIKAYEREFKPLGADEMVNFTAQIPYYTRQNSDLVLDFATQSTSEIITRIKAFATRSQMVHLNFDKNIAFLDATLLQNDFLSRKFKANAINDVVLKYENFALCKREEGFLQLMLGDLVQIPANLSYAPKEPYNVFKSSIYAKNELENNDEIFTFSHTRGYSHFSNVAIISPIAQTGYFDMSSTYGYGGYFSTSGDLSFLADALEIQAQKAKAKNIIAEFIRFHPYMPYAKHFAPMLDMFAKERDIIEVSTDEKLRWSAYSSRLRGKLRKSLANLEVRQSEDLRAFYALYTQTMDRNQAAEFYYFKFEYFMNLLKIPNATMLEARYKGDVVAMGIFLFDEICGYYHLGASANFAIDNNLNAMGALFEAFFDIAKKKNLAFVILGGGHSSDGEDSLFKFKKQFATNLRAFYIGGKIYDKSAFDALKVNNTYFLSYRFGKKPLNNAFSMGGGIAKFAKFSPKTHSNSPQNSVNLALRGKICA